jgi:hypothetical protein
MRRREFIMLFGGAGGVAARDARAGARPDAADRRADGHVADMAQCPTDVHFREQTGLDADVTQ